MCYKKRFIMDIFVTNTLTGKKEKFVPRETGKVSMYVCGMTVQDYPHVGHARCYITFDMVKRFLTYLGYNVTHIQNYTDIDDKIIAKANVESLSAEEVAEKYKKAFEEDMNALGIIPANEYPLATKFIPQIINMIKTLIEKGYAYEVDGDVFFEVRKFKGYGKLSKRTLEEMRAGERVEVDERKNDPMDFALWKSSKPDEPFWESPWGNGRPGWHIECSAMSLEHLKSGFDIHGGGQDLIFPHHENEIAQSEAYSSSEPFVRYWLHNGFVNLTGEKMSKSLGNIINIRDLVKSYPAQIIRLFVLGTHYRSPIDFTEEGLLSAKSSLEGLLATSREAYSLIENKLQNDENNLQNQQISDIENFDLNLNKFKNSFENAMCDDFNTPLALSVLYEIKDSLNLFMKKFGTINNLSVKNGIKVGRDLLVALANVFGFDIDEKAVVVEFENIAIRVDEAIIKSKIDELPDRIDDLLTLSEMQRNKILDIVKLRLLVRKNKDYTLSDYIRNKLGEKNINLEDIKNGTRTFTSPW